MNSFQRFEKVLTGQKPDKLPFYYPAIASDVASEILGRPVETGNDSAYFAEERSWLGGEAAHTEFVEKMHEDNIAVYRALRADVVRETLRGRQRPTEQLDDYTLRFARPDGTHVIKRYFPETHSYGVVESTIRKPQDSDELVRTLAAEMEAYREPTDETLTQVYADALAFREKAAPYFPAIVNALGFGIPMYEPVWLETMVLEPDLLREYFLFKAESYLPHIRFLKKKGYRFLNGGMDLAMQNGVIYSPAAFRRVIFDGLKILSDACRKEGMVYCYRTDGNIWAIFDMLFSEIGIQAYGEVDRLADMTVEKIRRRAPSLILLGNSSSATLHSASEAEVREETARSLRESGGTGFLPGPSNAIMAGTPVKNLFAMAEEIEKYNPLAE